MTRINTIEVDAATGSAKELLEAVQKKMGMVPNLTKVMAQAPVVLETYLKGSEALSGGVLSAVEREHIALRTAELNQCQYCLSAHSALGKMQGLSEDEVLATRAGKSEASRAQAILDFTAAVVRERGKVTDDDLAEARDGGLTEADLVEVVGHVALNLLTNYLNNVAGTAIDFPKAAPLKASDEAAA